MKRKYLLGSLIFLSFLSIGTPTVAGNGYILGVSPDQVFIWQVTTLDSTGLSVSIGGGWAGIITANFGASSSYGARYKYEIVSTGPYIGELRVDFEYWLWTVSDFSPIADQTNAWTVVHDDPVNATGIPYDKFYVLSVSQLFLETDFASEYIAVDNVIARIIDSFSQEIECRWTFSKSFGVLESFQIKNINNALIYEHELVSVPSAPFDLLGFLLMPAIFIGIGVALFTVGIVIGKKR